MSKRRIGYRDMRIGRRESRDRRKRRLCTKDSRRRRSGPIDSRKNKERNSRHYKKNKRGTISRNRRWSAPR